MVNFKCIINFWTYFWKECDIDKIKQLLNKKVKIIIGKDKNVIACGQEMRYTTSVLNIYRNELKDIGFNIIDWDIKCNHDHNIGEIIIKYYYTCVLPNHYKIKKEKTIITKLWMNDNSIKTIWIYHR